MDREALKKRYPNSGSLFDTKEEDAAIVVDGLTKDYGKGRGLFDISFLVPKGVTFGYCGTNGAGKTTTLRHIMGFLKPQKGKVFVLNKDSWKCAEEIKNHVGYLPGEIAFPPLDNGSEFLKLQAEMIQLESMEKAERLINALQLDPTANLKRMSKGMKQKTAMVACFMADRDVIILDEPTTGLDPLMREVFINIVRQEKERGASIIMSNHMFDELEETCDYVAFIKEGKIVDIVDVNKTIRSRPIRNYSIKLKNKEDFLDLGKKDLKFLLKDEQSLGYLVEIDTSRTDEIIQYLAEYDLASFHEIPYSLERYFKEEVIKENKENE